MEKFALKHSEGKVEVEALGFSLEEALGNAGVGLMAGMASEEALHLTHGETAVIIEERAETLSELAHMLLNDLLTESNERDLLFKEVSVEKLIQNADGVHALIVARGGPLDGVATKAIKRVSVSGDGVVQRQKGNWSVKALAEI